MLEQVEVGEQVPNLKMNVLQALEYITKAWEEITANTIQHCWCHTKIIPIGMDADLRNLSDNTRAIEDSISDELCKALGKLGLSDSMEVDEFLSIAEESVVYEVPDDNQIINELVEMFRIGGESSSNLEDMDNSTETTIISASDALKSLEIVQTFLIQQENTKEQVKMANILERYIRERKANMMRQTNIDQYFMQCDD